MNNYDKMIEVNKKRSDEKIDLAITEIRTMLEENKQVIVCSLVKRTGLSRGFYYGNSMVRAELNRAQKLQADNHFARPEKVIFDKAMEKEIELLKSKVVNKEALIIDLTNKINRLQATIEKQTIDILNNL